MTSVRLLPVFYLTTICRPAVYMFMLCLMYVFLPYTVWLSNMWYMSANCCVFVRHLSVCYLLYTACHCLCPVFCLYVSDCVFDTCRQCYASQICISILCINYLCICVLVSAFFQSIVCLLSVYILSTVCYYLSVWQLSMLSVCFLSA